MCNFALCNLFRVDFKKVQWKTIPTIASCLPIFPNVTAPEKDSPGTTAKTWRYLLKKKGKVCRFHFQGNWKLKSKQCIEYWHDDHTFYYKLALSLKLRPIYTSKVSEDKEVRHLNQREVSGEENARKRIHSVLLPSLLPSPFVDLHLLMQVSYVSIFPSVSTYFTSENWPLVLYLVYVHQRIRFKLLLFLHFLNNISHMFRNSLYQRKLQLRIFLQLPVKMAQAWFWKSIQQYRTFN